MHIERTDTNAATEATVSYRKRITAGLDFTTHTPKSLLIQSNCCNHMIIIINYPLEISHITLTLLRGRNTQTLIKTTHEQTSNLAHFRSGIHQKRLFWGGLNSFSF